MKRGDDNELKRNLKLEKVVDSSQLGLAVEKEEQDWRMLQLLNGSVWPRRWTKKENQDWKMVATAQLMLALTKGAVNVGVVLSLNPFRKVGNYAYHSNLIF